MTLFETVSGWMAIHRKLQIYNKDQPLVTAALNGNLLNYNGRNRTTYLIVNDDDAYEERLNYKGISNTGTAHW